MVCKVPTYAWGDFSLIAVLVTNGGGPACSLCATFLRKRAPRGPRFFLRLWAAFLPPPIPCPLIQASVAYLFLPCASMKLSSLTCNHFFPDSVPFWPLSSRALAVLPYPRSPHRRRPLCPSQRHAVCGGKKSTTRRTNFEVQFSRQRATYRRWHINVPYVKILRTIAAFLKTCDGLLVRLLSTVYYRCTEHGCGVRCGVPAGLGALPFPSLPVLEEAEREKVV